MKRILYASGSVVTGDAVAHSLVRYAATLARAGSADTITIPVVKDRKLATVEMLIGPSSQLILEDAGSDPDDAFTDDSFQVEIDQRRDRVENPPSIKPRGKPDETASLLDDF
ncbi:hypothetical protein BH11ACT4_BH11ACT4_05050 [soil metagenome]